MRSPISTIFAAGRCSTSSSRRVAITADCIGISPSKRPVGRADVDIMAIGGRGTFPRRGRPCSRRGETCLALFRGRKGRHRCRPYGSQMETAMSRLDRHVTAVQNKLALDRFLGALAWASVFYAAAIWIGVLVYKVLRVQPPHTKWWVWGGAGACALVAFVWALIRRPTAHEAAV